MSVQATVVEDSIAPSGIRLTTMLLTYATMVHQDFLTHRTVYKLNVGDEPVWIELDSNKSTNSNRAKPTKQVLYEVWRNPFCPTRFPKRAASMHSSKGYLTGWKHTVARHVWLKARYVALAIAMLLMLIGVHKQIANRLLMPWTYTTLVMTAIDAWWQHFFDLRAHYMAQDEVQEAAREAQLAYAGSVPKVRPEGDWHLPFISGRERDTWPLAMLLCISVARCARTSYAPSHQEMLDRAWNTPITSDMQLYRERLHPMKPEHAGPKEHQAQSRNDPNHQSGTLVGWDQLRHSEDGNRLLAEECA